MHVTLSPLLQDKASWGVKGFLIDQAGFVAHAEIFDELSQTCGDGERFAECFNV